MASSAKEAGVEGKCIISDCDSCNENGQTVAASSFCCDCEKYICSGCEKWHAKFSRNHKTIAGDDLPEAIDDLDTFMQCGSHAKHSVEFYCEEHQSVFCRLCRHIKHGDCGVKNFGTACQGFDMETEFNGAVENLQVVIEHIAEAKSRGQEQLEKLGEETEQRKSFVKNFKWELGELLNRYETQSDEYDQANTERAKAVLASVNVYLKQTEEQIRLLKETKGHLGEDAIFLSLIKSNQLCKEYMSKIEDIASDAKEHNPFTFHNENISTLLEKFTVLTREEQPEHTGSDETGLGEATNDPKEKSFWNIKACSLHKDSVVTTGDEKHINITACCTMANGEVILCDSANNKMMLMNKNLKILSDINIPGQPFDVAEMDDNTVVLACPSQCMIQLVTIKPGLKLEQQIAVGQACYGIALQDKKLYTCICIAMWNMYSQPAKPRYSFKILSAIKWDVLKTIDIVTDASPQFISPSSDGTNIFLSGGDGQDPIVCISKEGHIIYKYFDDTLESPSDIFADAKDNLLVRYAGTSAEKSTGLRIIKSGGECGKDLLLQEEILGKITALHFDKRSDLLLVASEDKLDEKTVSKLRMFKLEY